MAYDMRNPSMNQNNGYPSSEEKKQTKMELCEELDHIATYLFKGVLWHLRAANASRKILVRGPGRWHDDGEATGDFMSLKKLLKLSRDKLGYDPHIDMDMVARAEDYTMNSSDDFKKHFTLWDESETELIDCLNHAIHLSRTVCIEIYEMLICLVKEVENERTRANMTKDSFAFGGWSGHDISVKSKWIHEYMEHEHKPGDDINFNLG